MDGMDISQTTRKTRAPGGANNQLHAKDQSCLSSCPLLLDCTHSSSVEERVLHRLLPYLIVRLTKMNDRLTRYKLYQFQGEYDHRWSSALTTLVIPVQLAGKIDP